MKSDFGHFLDLILLAGRVTCGFVLCDCRSCALGAAVLWSGVPVSADGQGIVGRDGRADRALIAARV
ncbi:MAG TPA: hypothetical protein VII50_08305, partial [Acidothermaceae bacterium]